MENGEGQKIRRRRSIGAVSVFGKGRVGTETTEEGHREGGKLWGEQKTLELLQLLILLVDGEDGAVGIESDVEGFGFLDEDVGELFFLGEGYRLQFDHFEDGQERYDHGVTRRAGVEEVDEADGAGVAREDLAAELRDHLGDGESVVLQFDAGDFFSAFEDL